MPWAVAARQFRLALPGYRFTFPADHASHNEFKTEWWYYTGHLTSAEGRKFGYELTFFRSAMAIENGVKNSPWAVDNVYLAHFAVSDLASDKFFYDARLTRPGIGAAGAGQRRLHVWNQSWFAELSAQSPSKAMNSIATVKPGEQVIEAKSSPYQLQLRLLPLKPPAVHGLNGVSQKASCRGCASHYYSLTNMQTAGELVVEGRRFQVHGTSWMDHEFGSNQLQADESGWDWFSIQLDDKTELMLYVMRRKDGTSDPNSSGTFVAIDGSTSHLPAGTYKIKATGTWKSPLTGAVYPMGWTVTVPGQKLVLNIVPLMLNQELGKKRSFDVTYWEGACKITGNRDGKPLAGQAYVEMTGYADPFASAI